MANEPPSTLHSKRRVITGSLLVKLLKAIESKPVVAPLLMEVPLLSGTLAVSVATVGAVRSTVHVKTDNGMPTFP